MNSKHPKYATAVHLLAEVFIEEAKESLKEMAKENPDITDDPVDVHQFASDLATENTGALGDDLCNTIRYKLFPHACPGCGKNPGEGITDTCTHEDGCGFWKKLAEAAS